MPAMPEGLDPADIMRGLYRWADAPEGTERARHRAVQRLGAGRRSRRGSRAGRAHGIGVELWSATSYKALRDDALVRRAVEPPAPARARHVPAGRRSCSAEAQGPIVAVSDFMKIVPEQVARFLPGRTFVPLGTDGMGRSDTREALRRLLRGRRRPRGGGRAQRARRRGQGQRRRGAGRDRPPRHRSRRGRPFDHPMSQLARRAVRKARTVLGGARRAIRVQQVRSSVHRSGWFDADWYLHQYPELPPAGVTDPLDHYVRWGVAEGRSPGPDFDADAYRIMNPSSVAHPLLHYLAEPRRGGRLPAPADCIDPAHPVLRSGCFDADWYCRTYGEAVRDDIHPLVDYVWHGIGAGRSPGPVFHGPRYLHEFAEATAWRSPIHHFLEAGRAQGMFPTGLAEAGDEIQLGPLLEPRRAEVAGVGPRIAVVVHAYYVDVLADLLECVATLPAGHHLFIAVREAADVDRAARGRPCPPARK